MVWPDQSTSTFVFEVFTRKSGNDMLKLLQSRQLLLVFFHPAGGDAKQPHRIIEAIEESALAAWNL